MNYNDMLLDSINNILDGGDPSDFEMSFDIVRRVMELKIELEDYRRRDVADSKNP